MELSTFFAQALFGFLATFGFAILFNVPRKILLSCSLIGAGGHLLRFVMRNAGISNELATFVAATVVGLVGYWQAYRMRVPRIGFTVTGIISMVPGIPAYETLFYFNRGDILEGLQSAVRATLVAGAIAAGLSTARFLTETEWRRHS